MPVAQWIRQRLIEAEPRGYVCADLHRERKQVSKSVYRGGTYDSFRKFFWLLYRLGYIKPTGEEEISFIKGTAIEFSRKGTVEGIPEGNVPRIYYRITDKGLSVTDWGDPIAIKYPKFAGYKGRCKPYRKKTGRPIGRPRGTYTGRKRAKLPPIAHKEPTSLPL